MTLRWDARKLALGLFLPTLAGCATTTPTGVPAIAGGDMAGAQAAPEAQVAPEAQDAPGAGLPAQIPLSAASGMLYPLDYVTTHPILDYSWYRTRGNFATFGWAPGFGGISPNAMYYNTGSAWAPYTFDATTQCYQPYTTHVGGQVAYPYFGYGGYPYYSLGYPYGGLGYGYGGLGIGYGGYGRFGRFGGTGRRGFGGGRGYGGGRGFGGGRGGGRR